MPKLSIRCPNTTFGSLGALEPSPILYARTHANHDSGTMHAIASLVSPHAYQISRRFQEVTCSLPVGLDSDEGRRLLVWHVSETTRKAPVASSSY